MEKKDRSIKKTKNVENYGKNIPNSVCFHFEIAGDILEEAAKYISEEKEVKTVLKKKSNVSYAKYGYIFSIPFMVAFLIFSLEKSKIIWYNKIK